MVDFFNNKASDKAKKLIMYWGDSIADWQSGKKNTGYLIMQYYPEELTVSRSAEYDTFTPGLGVGNVQSWTGTSGIDIGSLNVFFSRDRADDKFLWKNNYEYDVELVISALYSLLIPDYNNTGGILDLPPQVWFDFGYDIFGYGKTIKGDKNSNFVSRFYITSLSHTIEAVFPDTDKIRAVSFDISVEETVFYDGKIDSAIFKSNYKKALKAGLARDKSNDKDKKIKFIL